MSMCTSRAAIEIARDSVELVKHFEEVARNQVRHGGGGASGSDSRPDGIGPIADRLETLEQLRGPIVAQLNAVLNRPTRGLSPLAQSALLSRGVPRSRAAFRGA